MSAFKARYYSHTQSSPSTTWTINHNLGCKPVVEVTVDVAGGGREKIFPLKVLHSTDNQTVVTFSTTRTGVARLVGIST